LLGFYGKCVVAHRLETRPKRTKSIRSNSGVSATGHAPSIVSLHGIVCLPGIFGKIHSLEEDVGDRRAEANAIVKKFTVKGVRQAVRRLNGRV